MHQRFVESAFPSKFIVIGGKDRIRNQRIVKRDEIAAGTV